MFLHGRMMRTKAMIVVLVASAVLQSAEPASGKFPSLSRSEDAGVDFYISYALEHNPRILAAIDNVEVKKREAQLSASLPDPMVMVKANSSNSSGISAIGASQMIMWPGKLNAMRRAGNHLTEAKQQELAAVMAEVEAEVRVAYATLYSIGQTIQRKKENLDLLKVSEQVARAQYVSSGIPQATSTMGSQVSSGNSSMSSSGRANPNTMGQMNSGSQMNQMSGSGNSNSSMGSMSSSTVNQSALLKIQVEQAMLEDQINNAQISAESERNRFRVLLGAKEPMEIPLPEKIVSLQLPNSKEEILKAVQEKSPQILAMERQLASASSMVTAARNGFFPDVSLGVEYMPSSSNGSMVTTSMGSDQSKGGNWEAGISVSVPLWVGNKKKEIERAKKMESGMRHELEDMKNMAIAETEVLLNNVYDADRRIALYRDVLVPQSKQVVDIVQASYRAGQNSYLDIIEGQRTLLNLQITLAEEQARREIALAGILRMIGRRKGS